MDQDMITDVTLDHLPDLSEESLSFQIPTDNASADLLLADHTDGFELLCNADDDDASFAPAMLRHPRGPALTLGELTPRAEATSPPPPRTRSRTPTQVPSSSAKPSVIHPSLTLGHRSPDKRGKTPSRTKSIHRLLKSPLVSEERLDQLRVDVKMLGQADETLHMQVHVAENPADGSIQWSNPSRPNSKLSHGTLDDPPASIHRLDPLPEEKDTHQDVEPPAYQDVVMATSDDRPAEAANIPVPVPRAKSKRIPRTSAKHTLAAEGISKRPAFSEAHVSKKTKNKLSNVREAHQAPPSAADQPTPPQSITTDAEQTVVPPASMSGDIDFKSENTPITHGGIAERLVSYSQKLISSIGLYKPYPEDTSTEASNDAVRAANALVGTLPPATALPPSPPPQFINNIANANIKPFRLSEISPFKQPPNSPNSISVGHTGIPQEGRQMSPIRPAKKRSTMDVDADLPQEYHRRKRGKTEFADADSGRRSSHQAVSQAQHIPAKKARHEDEPVTQSETRDDTRHLDSRSTLPNARTKYKPKLKSSFDCKGPTLDAFPYLSRSRQVHDRNKGRDKRDGRQSKAARTRTGCSPSGQSPITAHPRQGNARKVSRERQRSGPISTVDLPLIEKKQNATLSMASLTKPVGFTFRVDARLEARKAEERLAVSDPGKTHSHNAVPELKALRASHQAEMVYHKEGVIPRVPAVPFVFCTEQRAKEREKFDGMVRRKQEEMERLKEEEQRCLAEEEERTIKELRRKAIPKANEMPEWYTDMPKRKGTAV